MRLLKFLEFYKLNDITIEDILECIEKDGFICAKIIKDLSDLDDEEHLIPLSVDDDGLITINYNGNQYEVELKNVKRCEWDDKDNPVNENLVMHDQFWGILKFLDEKKHNKIAEFLMRLSLYEPYYGEINNLNVTDDFMISYLSDARSLKLKHDEIYSDRRRAKIRVGRAIKKIIELSEKYFHRIFQENFIIAQLDDMSIFIMNDKKLNIIKIDSISKNIEVIIHADGKEYHTKYLTYGEVLDKDIRSYKKYIALENSENFFKDVECNDNTNFEFISGSIRDLSVMLKTGRREAKLEFISPLKSIIDSDIELFVNEFISAVKSNLSENCKIEEYKGEIIRDCYNLNNYVSNIGKLGNSCMALPEISHYLDIYVENPDCVSILVLKNNSGKITGRALLWKLDGGNYFMDRVYTILDNEENVFTNYAIKNGWYYRSNGDNMECLVYKDGKMSQDELKVTLDKFDFKYYPYLDTIKFLCFVDEFSEKFAYITNDPYSSYTKELTSTRGGFN